MASTHGSESTRPQSGTYGVVHRVSSGGAIGEYRAANGSIAITMQNADNSEVVREWLTEGEVREHIARLTAVLADRAEVGR